MVVEESDQLLSYLIPITFIGGAIVEFIFLGIKIWELRHVRELALYRSFGLVAIFFNFTIILMITIYISERKFDLQTVEFLLLLTPCIIIGFGMLAGKLWLFNKFNLLR